MSTERYELLRQLIQPVNGKVPTLDAIGHKLGITREGVRLNLRKYGLKKPKSNAGRPCIRCGATLDAISRRQQESGLCVRCNPFTVIFVPCVCGQCDKHFLLSLTKYNLRTRDTVGFRTTPRTAPRTAPLFCSQPCSGTWLGLHYGFGVHGKSIPPRKAQVGETVIMRRVTSEHYGHRATITEFGRYRSGRTGRYVADCSCGEQLILRAGDFTPNPPGESLDKSPGDVR